MKKLLFIISFFCLLALNASQSPLKFNSKFIGISSGIGYTNTSAFSIFTNTISNKKYPAQFNNGIEAYGTYQNCIIGVSANLIHGKQIKSDSMQYTLSGSSINFNWAYKIYHKKQLIVFPMVGAGISSYGINIEQLIQAYANEKTYYSLHQLRITTISPYIDMSFNCYKLLNKNKKSSALGIKLGYCHGIKNSNWTYTGGSVTEGPKFGLRMLYFKVNFGIFNHKKI